ncbi:MAG TPA: peptidylprolyl isomerase [Gemmatimonadaceae bacterium]
MNRFTLVAAVAAVILVAPACIPQLGGCKAENPNPNTAPDSFLVAFETSRGKFDVMVRKEWAPIGAYRLHELVTTHHFDDARFFRVLRNFVAQFGLSGDPKENAAWEKRCLADDPRKKANARGTLTFANAGPDTRSTQLFVNLKDNPQLDGPDPIFAPIGEVVSGMSVVDSLYSEYGDAAPRSGSQYMREGPNQDSIFVKGNAYLASGWPKLDFIKTARVVQEWPKR